MVKLLRMAFGFDGSLSCVVRARIPFNPEYIFIERGAISAAPWLNICYMIYSSSYFSCFNWDTLLPHSHFVLCTPPRSKCHLLNSGSSPQPLTFRVPDFTSRLPFAVVCYPNGGIISDASDKWYGNGCSRFTDKQRRDLRGLKAGVLAVYIYHDTDNEYLWVICNFKNYIFHLDDQSDGLLTEEQ